MRRLRNLLNEFQNPLGLFCVMAGAAGVVVPGYTYFTTYPPPIFPGITLITGALSAFIVYCILTSVSPDIAHERKRYTQRIVRWAIVSVAIALICLTVYAVLLRYCTVIEPQGYSHRFQVGFWKYNWCLTEAGLSLKRAVPLAPLEDWMLVEGAFREGGPEIIWQAWSIMTAGILLAFAYFAAFALWTIGFSLLACTQRRIRKV